LKPPPKSDVARFIKLKIKGVLTSAYTSGWVCREFDEHFVNNFIRIVISCLKEYLVTLGPTLLR